MVTINRPPSLQSTVVKADRLFISSLTTYHLTLLSNQMMAVYCSRFIFTLIALCLIKVQVAHSQPLLLPGFGTCNFQNKTYTIGQKFQPALIFGGKIYKAACIYCTCKPTTLVQCTPVVCPTLSCANPIRLEGECCDKCPNEVKLIPGLHKCVHNGVTYEHGSIFHPFNVTNGTNQYCASCSCKNGSVSCKDVYNSCRKPVGCKPSEQYIPEGHCCKACPKPDHKNGECFDENGKIRQHGEHWHPFLLNKLHTCLNCTCNNTRYECRRFPCPPVPLCTGNNSENNFVGCCPTCSKNVGTNPPQNSTPNPTPTGNSTTSSISTLPTPPPTIIKSCETKYTHNIYLCSVNTLAIENVKNKTVVICTWLTGGVKDVNIVSSQLFLQSPCSLKMIGSTIERRVRGLHSKPTKREKIQKCKKNCAELVARMLRPVPITEQEC